jgi:hypothetical protein
VNTGENQWEVNYEHGQCLNSVYTHVLFWTRSATRSTWHECSDRRSCDWSRLVSSKKTPMNYLNSRHLIEYLTYICVVFKWVGNKEMRVKCQRSVGAIEHSMKLWHALKVGVSIKK